MSESLPNMKLAGTRGKLRKPHTPKPALPPMPDWLNPAAQKEWRNLAPMLAEEGLIARIDADILALFCDRYATYQKLSTERDRDGGDMQRCPGCHKAILHLNHAKLCKLSTEILNYCRRLGMTPMARAQMNR